ncbi:MAG: hypothetical protein H7067_11400 [Burkholderiales bacterium]|nr:hypothetical protein [Opitutaceae bacterium]
MINDWQTPLALAVVAIAAASLIIPAWRKHRRAATGACGSSDEGCGCSAIKKNLRAK